MLGPKYFGTFSANFLQKCSEVSLIIITRLHGELHDGVDNVVGIVLQGLHRLPSRYISLGGEKLKVGGKDGFHIKSPDS